MAGTLVVDSPSTDTWKTQAIGQAVWDQCKPSRGSQGNFEIWKEGCCKNPSSCSAGKQF
jgi:hypothetical protein